MKPILQLVNVNKTYDDGFVAIKNFNLSINKGEFVTLLGPSGCGKTTMLKIIGGFEDPTKGKILYNGLDIKDMPIVKRPTSTVFQDYALFPNMTVTQNIQYGLKLIRTNSNNIPKNMFIKANKIYSEAKKVSKRKIYDIKKKREALKKDILKLEKKYAKYSFLREIKDMRRPEFLAALDFLYEKLEKNNVEISKLSFKQRFLINLNLLFNFFRLPFSIEVSTKNMNEIEKEIFKLKRLYYYKKNIDDKYDKLQDKYNDLDYDISYWQNYPNLQKEAFEKRNITRKLTKEEIEQKTKYVIKLVGLEGKEDKYPHDLSGGMQQRVALARSIVIETEILLLDEPLGALDAKVRKQLQDEIKRLHKELGLTFILVTHDQEEALMLSDKIVVMSEGKIEQIGTPNEIYDTPQNLWVANFIGRANILNGVMKENDVVEFYDVVTNVKTQENIHTNDKVKIIIRPEDIDIVKNKKGVLNNVEILDVIYKGLLYDIKCKYNENIINVESTDNIEIGSIVGLKFDLSDIHLIKDKNNE